MLREALARDEHAQLKGKEGQVTKAEAARKVKSFIQNIMHFRDESLRTPSAPIEHVAVFDEAQRAWDRSHLANFMSRKKGRSDFAMSEPQFLISVMDRHTDWCTVVYRSSPQHHLSYERHIRRGGRPHPADNA